MEAVMMAIRIRGFQTRAPYEKEVQQDDIGNREVYTKKIGAMKGLTNEKPRRTNHKNIFERKVSYTRLENQ